MPSRTVGLSVRLRRFLDARHALHLALRGAPYDCPCHHIESDPVTAVTPHPRKRGNVQRRSIRSGIELRRNDEPFATDLHRFDPSNDGRLAHRGIDNSHAAAAISRRLIDSELRIRSSPTKPQLT